jgi:DNA polymerase-3 subunit epsilon
MIVFYDFETTGFIAKGLPLTHESQPHIVQVGAIVTDLAGRKVGSFDVIVKPEGWKISDSAAAVHGISQEFAEQYGIAEKSAFGLIKAFMKRATLRVAHNEDFDQAILRVASHRYDDGELAALMNGIPSFCTMQKTIDLCKIPPTNKMLLVGIDSYKSPKLSESYRHLFGEELEGAHDAMVDILACKRIYEHLHAEN